MDEQSAPATPEVPVEETAAPTPPVSPEAPMATPVSAPTPPATAMPATGDLSLGAAFSAGWKITMANLGTFVVSLIVAAVITGIVQSIMNHSHGAAYSIMYVVNVLVSLYVALGLFTIYFAAFDGQKPELGMLFKVPGAMLGNYFVAYIISLVAIILASLLFVIPGIYVALMLSQVIFVIVDQKLGAMDALRASMTLTKGAKWHLIGMGFLSFFVCVVGVICLGIGILVAVPVAYVAGIHFYRQLVERAKLTQTPA